LFKIRKHNDEDFKALRMDVELGYFSDSLLGKKDNEFDLKGTQNGYGLIMCFLFCITQRLKYYS
jgi:hypothetical protein